MLILVGGMLAVVGLPPAVGRPAPAFELEALGGGRAGLADLRGHAVVLNFWASWCKPCREEMPEIVLRYERLHQAGLEVLAVNLTDEERRSDIRRFVEEFRLPFPVLLDVKGKVRRRYGLVGVPMTVFVDTGGVVAAVHTGPMSGQVLDRGLGLIVRSSEREVLPPRR